MLGGSAINEAGTAPADRELWMEPAGVDTNAFLFKKKERQCLQGMLEAKGTTLGEIR